jgi:CBS domain-containing protein
MPTAGEFCNRSVVFVEDHEDLLTAARLMRDQRVGCLVVVASGDEKRAPIGLVTDRDVLVRAVADELDLRSTWVRDAMTSPAITAFESEDLYESLRRLRQAGIRRMPVVTSDGVLAGLLTLDDVLPFLVGQLGDATGAIERELGGPPA